MLERLDVGCQCDDRGAGGGLVHLLGLDVVLRGSEGRLQWLEVWEVRGILVLSGKIGVPFNLCDGWLLRVACNGYGHRWGVCRLRVTQRNTEAASVLSLTAVTR